MALNKNKELKLYYSIKEVAEMFDVNESALRYWEKEFPDLKPKTNSRGIRQYTKENIERIRLIHNMVKVRGHHLASARKIMHANPHGTDKSTDVLSRLTAARDELKAIKAQLDLIV